MSMTGAGLDSAREAAINAVPAPANTAAGALAYAKAVRLADSTAIVTYFQQNAVVTTSDAQGGTNTGTIS